MSSSKTKPIVGTDGVIHLCLLGATGMVGSEVLAQCLKDDRIASILIIGRRSVGIKHDKITEIEHNNFFDMSSIEPKLLKVNVCIYCLGVYQAQVSKKMFWEITVGYLEALVKAFENTNSNIRFCLFSAQGASSNEKSLFRFAKAKGRAENSLLASNLSEKYIFRPGFIMPGPTRKSPSLGERLFRPIYRLFPVFGIDAPDLAAVMLEVGVRGDQKTILENSDLRSYTIS